MTKLRRTVGRWRACDPKAIAAGSEAQCMYAIDDARADILTLAEAIARFGTRPAAEPSQSGSAGEALRNLIAATNYLAATRISGDVDKIEFAQQKVWQCLDEGNAALSQPVIAAPVEAAMKLMEERDAFRRALEVIAVGDSKDPVTDAGDELVALGFWRKDALDAHRAAPTLAEPAQQEGLK